MPRIDVNTDEVIKHTAKLERLRKKALPFAVKKTLDTMALDDKKKNIPKTYGQKGFVQRQRNFIKAFTKVDFAKAGPINKMKSEVGVVGNRRAARNMREQEYGGDLDADYIPFNQARTGQDKKKKVRSKYQIRSGFKAPNREVRKGDKKGFRRSVNKAGRGGVIKYGSTIFEVQKLGKNIKLKPLYTHKKGRQVSVKKKLLFRTTGLSTGKKGGQIYINKVREELSRL